MICLKYPYLHYYDDYNICHVLLKSDHAESYAHQRETTVSSSDSLQSPLFGTRDLFNISYSRELYLFSKFLHFEEIVRVKMAVCFEMIVSET